MNQIHPTLTSPTKAYVMTTLLEEPKHGFKIMQEFQVKFKQKLSPGQIYPLLKSMENKGFVTHKVIEQGHRVQKIFELTETGRTESLRLQNQIKQIFHL